MWFVLVRLSQRHKNTRFQGDFNNLKISFYFSLLTCGFVGFRGSIFPLSFVYLSLMSFFRFVCLSVLSVRPSVRASVCTCVMIIESRLADPRTHPRASNLTHTRYIPCRYTDTRTDFFIRALAERSLVRVLDF